MCFVAVFYSFAVNVGKNISVIIAKGSLSSCELYAPPVKIATISNSGKTIIYCPPFPVAVLEIYTFSFALNGMFHQK